MKAFDMLYSIYCRKFKELDLQEETREESSKKGVSLLVDLVVDQHIDLKDSFKPKESDANLVIKLILGIFSILMIFLYYIGLYFAVYDSDKEVPKDVYPDRKNQQYHYI